MAVYPNGYRTAAGFLQNYTFFGVPAFYFYNSECGTGSGSRNNRFISDAGVIPQISATPEGYGMNTPFPPFRAGSISTSQIYGRGAVNSDMILALEAEATLLGTGDITAFGGLIVNLIATIAGSGGVVNADVKAFLNLAATITGQGGVATSSQLKGLGALAATIIGTGAITATLPATGLLSATIRGYGDLTPEGLRDAVWGAVLANYPVSGTAGKTLELAGSGGVDYHALGVAVWAILLAEANDPGSMGEFVQNISGGGGGSGLTLAQFLALK